MRARPACAQLEADHAKYGLKGVKLYTAEWYKGSRGWKLTDPEAVAVPRQVRRARDQEHPRPQGPDDLAAGQGRLRRLRRRPRRDRLQRQLNFIVEHVGLPRIEDFCFMATQEPNVYAGLAVVIGGLMHARPKLLRQGHGRAAVLGRRGQDAVRLRLRDLGAEVADRGLRRLGDARRRRVLGLPAAGRRTARRRSSASTPPSSTASRCPAELQVPVPADEPASPEDSAVGVGVNLHAPESSRRSGRSTTRSSTSRSPRSASSAPAS